MANLFAAYGLWWSMEAQDAADFGSCHRHSADRHNVIGGIIDLFPLRNSSYVEMNYEKDDLVRWLSKNTKPNDIFLTDRFLTHPILLAGRRIFLGSHDSPAGHDLCQTRTDVSPDVRKQKSKTGI